MRKTQLGLTAMMAAALALSGCTGTPTTSQSGDGGSAGVDVAGTAAKLEAAAKKDYGGK